MRLSSGTPAPILEPTQAAGLGIYDLRAGRFDTEALCKAGIDERILPPIALAGTRVGQTDTSIPVFSALGDNGASLCGGKAYAVLESFFRHARQQRQSRRRVMRRRGLGAISGFCGCGADGPLCLTKIFASLIFNL